MRRVPKAEDGQIDHSEFEAIVQSIFEERQVLHGPFKGMTYPEFSSVGSSLYPKLLGTYERELSPLIESIAYSSYTSIVDIGCAEGYYAVGFSILCPQAHVYAYDTDNEARYLCQQMAMINGTSERISIGSLCDRHELLSLSLGAKALIISDCEGYETELFNHDVVKELGQHEFLIEVHDFLDVSISTRLVKAFRDTHDIQVITSISDEKKMLYYQLEELSGLGDSVKAKLLSEYRPGVMDWLYLKPRLGRSSNS